MLIFALLLQAELEAALAKSQWAYLGQSQVMAHYADANSIQRQGTRAAIMKRMVKFDPMADNSDMLEITGVNCDQRTTFTLASFKIVGGKPQQQPRGPLDNVGRPSKYYPTEAAVVDPVADAQKRRPH